MNEQTDESPTILVVDDNEDVRSMIRFWLEEMGFRVVQAANGEMGVETALRERPRVIVMDICMPHLDGFTAARRIRAHELLNEIPILAISAHDVDELQGAATDAGCDALLGKPIDADKLEQALNQFLSGSEVATENIS
jgi:two-component system, cell cycle response regulator DivK